jgi:hypothetical protein
MLGRREFTRPQGVIFSDNRGRLENGQFIPEGEEWTNFIILSDHNRSSMNINKERIENRERMINGTMRSYFTADKVSFSTSWQDLPSRAYSEKYPEFGNGVNAPEGELLKQKLPSLRYDPEMYTADGGAGGSDLLSWYDSFPGPFYVFLSYDKEGGGNFNKYTHVIKMFFSDFSYDIQKRGKDNFDMWNINVSLEEA